MNLQKNYVGVDVTGSVLDPAGKPKSNLDVSLTSTPATKTLSGKTDSKGAFEFKEGEVDPLTDYVFDVEFKNGVQ